ncbi:hypothetical protein LPB142_00495 [Rhodobacter xanthinilyticus]|uniref:HipA-like C-terminal domain-containing protein n=1 Tax=Rhodobacter xanthinilyticus TaxID=1850250 RepID=A0A1D9M7Z7_9RHOB|nr:hypothetical protein LPB142_00495 [Rhodobacter xanthinilyticus]
MKLLSVSDEPTKDRRDFFKATILFWLIGATDGHAKNFSLGLLPGGRFRLSPLYDVLTTQPLLDARQLDHRSFRLSMRVGKSRHYKVNEVLGHHFVETGTQAGLSREAIQSLFDEIHAQATEALDKTFADLPADFPEGLTSAVAAGLQTRLEKLVAAG